MEVERRRGEDRGRLRCEYTRQPRAKKSRLGQLSLRWPALGQLWAGLAQHRLRSLTSLLFSNRKNLILRLIVGANFFLCCRLP